jgi:hypothetical protein
MGSMSVVECARAFWSILSAILRHLRIQKLNVASLIIVKIWPHHSLQHQDSRHRLDHATRRILHRVSQMFESQEVPPDKGLRIQERENLWSRDRCGGNGNSFISFGIASEGVGTSTTISAVSIGMIGACTVRTLHSNSGAASTEGHTATFRPLPPRPGPPPVSPLFVFWAPN